MPASERNCIPPLKNKVHNPTRGQHCIPRRAAVPPKRGSRVPMPDGTCVGGSRPRHNAHNRPSRLTIHYRFHPHVGTQVELVSRRPSPAGASLVVRLPDGCPLTVPEWMTCADAGLLEIRDTPRFPPEALSELRVIIDSFLRFDANEGETNDATKMEDPTEGAVRPGRAERSPGRRPATGTGPSPGSTASGGGNRQANGDGGRVR